MKSAEFVCSKIVFARKEFVSVKSAEFVWGFATKCIIEINHKLQITCG